MKNLFKVLGIIAMIAVVGLAVSCEVDPEDQVKISISGIGDGANGLYAFFALSPGKDKGNLAAMSDSNNKISKGGLNTYMVDTDAKPFDKEGNYFVLVLIHDELITNDNIKDTKYTFYTSSPVKIVKGTNSFTADQFKDDSATTLEDAFATSVPDENKPTANDYGTYTTTYKNNAGTDITETVVLTDTSFNISDNTGGKTGSAADHLNFKIENWEKVTVPTTLSGYTGGYKFTGRILDQSEYVPSSKTAPAASGFSEANRATDVKADGTGTVCWMYIYFKGDVGNITFVRSAFSRTGSTENSSIVTGSETPPQNRVYTKK